MIGVPLAVGPLQGVDALLAEVQMPTGIPVATVAINGAANAAILSAQILALSDEQLQNKLIAFKSELTEGVNVKNKRLQDKLNNRL